MPVEFSPNGRGLLVITAILLTFLIWLQTSGAWLTLAVIVVGVTIATLLFWGVGTRVVRRVGGLR